MRLAFMGVGETRLLSTLSLKVSAELCGERLDSTGGFCHGIVRDRVDQADASGLLRMKFFSRHEHRQGTAFPEETRQALRSTPASNES